MGFALLQAVGVSFAFIALVVAMIVVASVVLSGIKIVQAR